MEAVKLVVSDPVIIAATAQGTALVAYAVYNGIDGLLVTGWVAVLSSIAGLSGGYKLSLKRTPPTG